MKALMIPALIGSLLAVPAFAQTSGGTQQMLQGLLSGNQSQDQTVRDAYERGYQKGRQDEARLGGSSRGDNRTSGSGRDYNGNRAQDDNSGRYPSRDSTQYRNDSSR